MHPTGPFIGQAYLGQGSELARLRQLELVLQVLLDLGATGDPGVVERGSILLCGFGQVSGVVPGQGLQPPVIMPTAGSLSDLTGSMTIAGLDRIVSSLKPMSLDLAMPTLSLGDSHELKPTLQSLGMRDAFAAGADLAGLSPTPLLVTDVVQKTTLHVTPWGTEATAATGIGVGTAARPASMALTIDHPFLLLIRDTHTGAILFEAQVDNPAAG